MMTDRIDGADLAVEVVRGMLRLTLTWEDGRGRSVLERPVPASGYGGHELVVAPDARCVAVFLTSGQHEVGFELVEVGRRLHPMFDLPHVRGDASAPVFTPNGAWLVMLVRTWDARSWHDADGNPVERPRRDDDDARSSDDARAGEWSLRWAELYALHVPTLQLVRSEIEVVTDRLPDVDLARWTTFGRLATLDDDRVEIELPWGDRTELRLPPGDLTVRVS